MSVFVERRRRLLERMTGAAVFPSPPITYRNGDVENEFRQDSDLYYLTGFAEPESVLVLSPSHPTLRQVLFMRPRDRAGEIWDGPREGIEEAPSKFGVDAAYSIREISERLPDLLKGSARLYYRLGRDRSFDDRVLEAVARVRGRGRTPHTWPSEIVEPAGLLHEMRAVKDSGEIQKMRRAAEITRDAHLAAMSITRPGMFEFEVEARLREVFRKNGSERPAYLPIVGSGPNATVLHYRANKRRIGEGDLVLIDAGCELDYYASDVTRTFPASGVFSDAQRRIYDIVLDAQLAAIEAVKPGATLEEIHDAAVRVIAGGLLGLGLLEGSVEKILENQAYRPFYMHRTSHWLGMDVHDVGAYFVGGKPRPLEPGMVLTVEPGIYIRSDNDNVPSEYRGIGVRIEDDIVVTDTGSLDLTADIPKLAGDVERACRA
ncbi:MAG: aminopeptidase P N-terminal domain-containing protein [Polyangiaceae bacterium]|nr:aminopeptidase P N-terminal domain-containing protein [Polyangiaceae bacterium]